MIGARNSPGIDLNDYIEQVALSLHRQSVHEKQRIKITEIFDVIQRDILDKDIFWNLLSVKTVLTGTFNLCVRLCHSIILFQLLNYVPCL